MTRWALLIFLTLGMRPWYYPAPMTVTEVRQGTVMLESEEGHTYHLEAAEAWRPGDQAECIMYSAGTEDKADDVIVGERFIWK